MAFCLTCSMLASSPYWISVVHVLFEDCQEGYMLKPNGKKCVPIKSCDDGFCLDEETNKCSSLANINIFKKDDGTCGLVTEA